MESLKMEVDTKFLNEVSSKIEKPKEETQSEEKPKQEEPTQKVDLSEIKPIVNHIHKTIFKIANKKIDHEVLDELDSSLVKILEKRMPKVAGLVSSSPEITYFMLMGTAVFFTPQEEETQSFEMPQSIEGQVVEVQNE
jgi:uncharacterized FlaG/YvyC family protein